MLELSCYGRCLTTQKNRPRRRKRDVHHAPAGRAGCGPGLAESWQPVGDTTWEFKLRRGVKWHDGTPFTADDVVFTFERVPAVPNSPSPMTGMILGKKIVQGGDYTGGGGTEKAAAA